MRRSMKLMGDNVLVKMDPDKELTSSGIIIKPKEAMETIMRTGVVVAVGPGKYAKKGERDLDKRVPIPLEVGDGVVFNRFVASNTKTAEALHQHVLDDDEALIKGSDVLLAYDRGRPITLG